MNTNHPTVELFFVFAYTYCKLRVYKKQEAFARRVLEAHNVEFLTSTDSCSWEEIDTRILLDLVGDAIIKIIPSVLTPPKEVAKQTAAIFGITQ